MRAVNLKTEYLKDPMGIDIVDPRLFWNCGGGTVQTAYQIVCRDDSGRILWDTGKVSGSSMRAVYSGSPLKRKHRAVRWTARRVFPACRRGQRGKKQL